MSEHTPSNGAMRAACIIMADQKTIDTAYGRKTQTGLAELIDFKTAAPDLLAACEEVTTCLIEAHAHEKIAGHHGDSTCSYCKAIDVACAAIAKAQ